MRKAILALIAITAGAAASTAATLSLSGSGTADSPYEVASATDWNTLSSYMLSQNATLEGQYVRITADISFSSTNISPLGVFGGDLDGNGKTLSGITKTISGSYMGAVVDTVLASGNIHDFTVEGTVTAAGKYTGGVAGALYGKMSNVTCKATVKGSEQYVGGVIGFTSGATIEDCVFSGTLTSSQIWLGGITGYGGTDCTYQRCGNTGTVTFTGTSSYAYASGLIGSTSNGTFIDCYNTGTVSGPSATSSNVAGLISHLYNGGLYTFKRCYNSGAVTGYRGVAGLTCRVNATTIYVDMDSCYNTGDITSTATSSSTYATTGLVTEIALASSYTNCWNSGNVTAAKTQYTAGLFGTYATMGSATSLTITFSGCYNEGTVTSGGDYTGGIFGRASYCYAIDSCYNTGAVTSSGSYTGGITGYCFGAGTIVTSSCYNAGDVTGDGAYVGGIAGYVASDTIKNCFNTGNIATTNLEIGTNTSYGYAIGGIAGYSSGVHYNVYNTGDISGANCVAGLVGATGGSSTVVAGGYSTGSVSCVSTLAGNIIGSASGSVSDTYYLSGNTVWELDSVSSMLSMAQLAALNIDGWENGDNYTYPRIATIADNDHAIVNAAVVIPATDNTYGYISKSFNVGTPSGVTWTASSQVVDIVGNDVSFNSEYTGSLTMTATSGSQSVSTELYCVVSDVDDIDGNKSVETFESIAVFTGDATGVQGVFTTWDFADAYVVECDSTSGNGAISAAITNGGSITSTLAITADTIRAITVKAWNTTSSVATLHLYYSTDRGDTWIEAFEDSASCAATVAIGAVSAKYAYMLELPAPTLFIKVAADGLESGQITVDDISVIYTGELSNVITLNLKGDGTQDSPYLIGTPDEWNAFAAYVAAAANTMNGEYVRLTADLDFSEAVMTQVGYDYYTYFDGDFDGDGKTIKGITATSDRSYFGALFTRTGSAAYIHNFSIEGTVTSSYDNTGGIVGLLSGTIGDIASKVIVTSTGVNTGGLAGYANDNAFVANCTNNAAVKGSGQCVAGIAGRGGSDVTYENCLNNGSITFDATSGNAYAAGIVGYSSRSSFIKCGNTASITTQGAAMTVAGIASYIYYTSDSATVFSGCYNTGDLTSYSCVCGIASVTGTNSKVVMNGCYNTGDITSTTSATTSGYTAGLMGYYETGSSYVDCYNTGAITSCGASYTAGLFAYNYTWLDESPAKLDSCYNYGNVASSGQYVGGLVALGRDVQISNSENYGAISGTDYVGGITGYGSGENSSISKACNLGNVSATGSAVGGIAGYAQSSLNDVYNAADVAGSDNVGGLVGVTVVNATSIRSCYSSGSVSASGTCGNIVGISTSNTAYWDSTNVIDNTYFLTGKAVVCTDDFSEGLTFAQMGSLELDGWDNGDSYTYPILTKNDYTLAHAAAVIPSGEDETYEEITGTLYLGTPYGVTWTASSSAVKIDGNTATFAESFVGPLTLTATCGDVSVATDLECNVEVDGISDISADASQEVVSEEFYTVSGTKVAKPKDGTKAIYIVVKTYRDGSTDMVKEAR